MIRPLDPTGIDGILARLRSGEPPDPGVADRVASLPAAERMPVLQALLEEPAARRWYEERSCPGLTRPPLPPWPSGS